MGLYVGTLDYGQGQFERGQDDFPPSIEHLIQTLCWL